MTFSDLSIAIILDVETTGRAPRRDRIVEIKMIKYDFQKQTVLESYFQQFNPHMPIAFMAQKANGLDAMDLQKAPNFECEVARIKAFIGDLTIIGHRVAFDMAFMEAEFDRLRMRGIGLNPWLCTMEHVPRKIAAHWQSYLSLQEAAIRAHVDVAMFGLPPEFVHVAKICGIALYFKRIEDKPPQESLAKGAPWRDLLDQPFVFWVFAAALFLGFLAAI